MPCLMSCTVTMAWWSKNSDTLKSGCVVTPSSRIFTSIHLHRAGLGFEGRHAESASNRGACVALLHRLQPSHTP